MVRHGGLSNLLGALRRTFGFGPGDRFLAIGTPAFDIHVLEIWHALSAGAELVIGGPDAAADGRVLARTLAQVRPTILTATPTTWRLLRAAGWDGDPNLTAVAGGEALTPDLAADLLPRVRALWNMYGPTEMTVAATWCRVTAADGPIPIGRPIDNTRAYVLDSRGQPVPAGVVGELYLAGAGVARGYLGRPDLTAERFVPSLRRMGRGAGGDEGPPAHKSVGLRVAKLPSTHLAGAGCTAPATSPVGGPTACSTSTAGATSKSKSAATGSSSARSKRPSAEAPGRRAGRGRRSARFRRARIAWPSTSYRVAKTNRRALPADLRAFLRTTLPEYMVPSAVVMLDRLPLTPGGKVDRKAAAGSLNGIPFSDFGFRSRTEHRPPNTDLERDLAAIWAEVLHVPSVGVDDDFFDLGGHSYQAVVLLTRVQERLGHSLPLGTLFSAPTIEKLAAVLQKKLDVGTAGSLVPVREEWPPAAAIPDRRHRRARLHLPPLRPSARARPAGVRRQGDRRGRLGRIAGPLRGDRGPLRRGDHRRIGEPGRERPEPVVLGGYSIGAVVAFELALQLQAAGRPVGPLLVFDGPAPDYPRLRPLHQRLLAHLRVLSHSRGRRPVELPAAAAGQPEAMAVAGGRPVGLCGPDDRGTGPTAAGRVEAGVAVVAHRPRPLPAAAEVRRPGASVPGDGAGAVDGGGVRRPALGLGAVDDGAGGGASSSRRAPGRLRPGEPGPDGRDAARAAGGVDAGGGQRRGW